MINRRLTRINELLKREIGTALFRMVSDAEFDTSAVTVTHVITSSNLRNARVLVSIRGNDARREELIDILRKHRVGIQNYLGENVILKYTPRLSFALDTSLEEGDRTLVILDELDRNDKIHDGELHDDTAP